MKAASGPAPADQDARDTITTRGLGRTLFVEAGAGTGKTTQLVERIVNVVLDEGVSLASIAAITFTEAAAAELQARIRVAFERHAAQPRDATTLARARTAIAEADLAAISTLHGFARRILAEHPVLAGLPPRIEILDEVSSELAREARWERFVDGLYDDPAHEPLLVRAALAGVPLEPRYQQQATMKDVAAELGQSWDRLGGWVEAEPDPLPPVDFSPFLAAAGNLERMLGYCIDHTDRLYLHLTTKVLPSVRAIVAMEDPERRLRALVAATKWGPGNGGKGPAWTIDVSTVKGAVAVVTEARLEVVTTVSHDVLSRLLVLVGREVLAAAAARRDEGRLEFHDLLVLARRLLRTSATARHELHERYTHLLLDEFQDTDPIQIELAMQIAAGVAGGPELTLETTPIGEGRLFFVGDPKQSIYRFRRADIEQFLNARDRFGPDGSWLRLITNFRTVPDVLAWVNSLFGRLMDEERPGRQPKYEALVAHRTGVTGGDHRPVLLGQPHQGKVYAFELRQQEADDVARTLEHIRDVPERWPVFDLDTKEWRYARLTDVTILVPTRTSLPFLREALARAGIAYRLDTGTLVYDTQEVRDALSVLWAIDDPSDALPLVAALRSPLYACSDRDLFAFVHAGGRWDLRKPAPDALGPDHPVAQALAHLRSLWKQRWWLPTSVLLDRLLGERRAFVLAFSEGRPKEVWSRLRFLVDQARAFDESSGGGLRAFLDWAELQRSERARVHEPRLPETDDVAVRIMTVHGAKGLEFPITVLSGMTTKPGKARYGVSVLWCDDVPEMRLRAEVATANHDPRADIEEAMDVDEKLRLLYVACTRARDHLVVACHHKAGDKSYANIVWDHFAGELDLWRGPPEAVPAPLASAVGVATAAGPLAGNGRPRQLELLLPADDDRQQWSTEREALLTPQRRARVVSATTIAAEAAARGGPEPVVDEDDDGADIRDEAVPLAVRRRGRAGSAVGRAVHATLQLLDLAAPEGVAEQAARQAELEAVPDLASTVEALVRSALGSEAVRLAATASQHHKELYVAAPVGGRIIEGYVDLLVETGDGLVIVDYKTDSVSGPAEADAKLAVYALQGAAYAVALEEATGLAVLDCRFVFCRATGAIERAVPDLPAAKARVRALVGDGAGDGQHG